MVKFLTMIISAIRVIVNLKVTRIATRGSLASTVSDSESDDDAQRTKLCLTDMDDRGYRATQQQ